MDWIRKTDSILSLSLSSLSSKETTRNTLPRRDKNNNSSSSKERAKEREKEHIESKACHLSSHHFYFILQRSRSLSETDVFLCGKKEKKKEQKRSKIFTKLKTPIVFSSS